MEIPNGAIATYTGTWPPMPTTIGSPLAFLFDSAKDVIQRVSQELVNDGLTLLNYNVTAGDNPVFVQGPFQVVLSVLNQSGQELDDNDLKAQINDAVVVATGSGAISASVTDVTQGNAGGSHQSTTVPTGQPGQTAPAGSPGGKGHACGDPSWSFFDDPGQYFSCLATKGLSTLGLVFIGLLVGIILIVAVEKKPV